jgi:transposase
MTPTPVKTRERILARYDSGKYTRAQVALHFTVSESLVKKLLKQRKKRRACRTPLLHIRPQAVGAPRTRGTHAQHASRQARNDTGRVSRVAGLHVLDYVHSPGIETDAHLL